MFSKEIDNMNVAILDLKLDKEVCQAFLKRGRFLGVERNQSYNFNYDVISYKNKNQKTSGLGG